MSGERDLEALVRGMRPVHQPGRFVFATAPRIPDSVEPVACVREDEGMSLVLEQDDADDLGLAYEFVAAMITLQVRSSLEAVGLTALVSQTLAEAGISCNVVAGHFHDHLFVPIERAHDALRLLAGLSAATSGRRLPRPSPSRHQMNTGGI